MYLIYRMMYSMFGNLNSMMMYLMYLMMYSIKWYQMDLNGIKWFNEPTKLKKSRTRPSTAGG